MEEGYPSSDHFRSIPKPGDFKRSRGISFMKIFFDTSAFVKRYATEPGSDDVMDLCRQADSLALSIICLPEMVSTLRRLL